MLKKIEQLETISILRIARALFRFEQIISEQRTGRNGKQMQRFFRGRKKNRQTMDIYTKIVYM